MCFIVQRNEYFVHPDNFPVTRIETDLRYSTLAWNAEEGGTLEPPETVQYVDYYEYENVEFGKPWGYWVIDNARGDEWAGSSIKDTRCVYMVSSSASAHHRILDQVPSKYHVSSIRGCRP